MSKLDKDTVLENFTVAYAKANGKAPTVEAKGGWYSVNGGKNVRLAQLEEMTAELAGGAPASKATQVKEPSPKTQKPKQASTKAKKSSGKKASFSVKDFYTQQITAVNAGAKAPR